METVPCDRSKYTPLWTADLGDGTYRNPILYTDYSDPDVIRVGEDFFMVASSFCNTPAVPVLHSKDLVNWKVISYAMEKLPFDSYDKPRHGCGAWAPAIRYREGIFYVFIPLPDEGIFMVKSKDPFGAWEEPVCVKEAVGWIDPCPFWDEDGQAYLINAFAKSRIGFKSVLCISPLKADGTAVLGEGKIVFDGNETQPTIEGPKLYKRNGYYYIFAPAGGVATGWQTVLRSRSIWGPYEEKIVLRQGSTPVNGPHQGAWVDTPGGQDWFLHFQDAGNAGRLVHLQPMSWENDWPVIGGGQDRQGCGEPVSVYQKPDVDVSVREVDAVKKGNASAEHDRFEGATLGLWWQWNANYKKEWYSLEGKGLTLYARPVESRTQLCDIPNLLLQKWPAPEFQITAKLDVSGMETGDVCGMISLGGRYCDLGVLRSGEKKFLVRHLGQWDRGDETEEILEEAMSDVLYLRMKVVQEKWVSFAYSSDGDNWSEAGPATEASPGRWVGVKAGLYAIHKGHGAGGKMQAEYFVFEKLS